MEKQFDDTNKGALFEPFEPENILLNGTIDINGTKSKVVATKVVGLPPTLLHTSVSAPRGWQRCFHTPSRSRSCGSCATTSRRWRATRPRRLRARPTTTSSTGSRSCRRRCHRAGSRLSWLSSLPSSSSS